MRVALLAVLLALAASVAAAALPAHAGAAGAAALVLLVAAVARGVASPRSGLVEATAWRSDDRDDPRVALGFDDGPHPERTPRVLDALRTAGVRATFFVVGENARRRPDLVRRIVEEGHEVALHGDSHSPWTAFFPRARMEREVEACRAAVHAAAGVTPRLYRPPFGLRSPAHAGLAARADLRVVGMARRGLDKTGRSPEALVARTAGRARGGEILSLHDGEEPGRPDGAFPLGEALPAILDALRARGLRPVPVGELLAERPYRESPDQGWTGRTRGGRLGHAFFHVVLRVAGPGAALPFLLPVATWFLLVHGEGRRASRALRRRLHGPAPAPVEWWWAWRHFLVFGRTLLWRAAGLARGGRPPELVYEGLDSVREVVEGSAGFLFVSAHLGDWFLGCRGLMRRDRRLHVLAYRGTGLGPHQAREGSDAVAYEVIDAQASPADIGLRIAAAIAAGDVVAMLADRAHRGDMVRVPFLGGAAAFPAGPWRMALVTGAPVIPLVVIPEAVDRVRVVLHAPIRVARGPREGRDGAVRAAAAAFARFIEVQVRRHPLQWSNFYDFWGNA